MLETSGVEFEAQIRLDIFLMILNLNLSSIICNEIEFEFNYYLYFF